MSPPVGDKLYLHMWNRPPDVWDEWNIGVFATTKDIDEIPGMDYDPLDIPDDAEHTVVEVVPGLMIYANGYDRASLEVVDDG